MIRTGFVIKVEFLAVIIDNNLYMILVQKNANNYHIFNYNQSNLYFILMRNSWVTMNHLSFGN